MISNSRANMAAAYRGDTFRAMAGRWFLALVIVEAVASASPRSDPTVGRAVFTGATLQSATSLSLNPAALAGGKATVEFYFAATGVLEQFGIRRKQIDAASGELVDGENVNDLAAGPGGSFAWLGRPSPRTTVGLELRIPSPELFPDGQALRYHSRGSKQRNYIATGGFGIRATSRFFFGASISHDVADLDLRYSRDTALDTGITSDCNGAPCGFENPAAAEDYKVDVHSDYLSSENLRVNLGIVVRLFNDLWIGIAYHNTPGFGIQTQLDGKMVVTKSPRDGGSVLRGDSTVLVSYPASVDGEVRTRLLPDLELHVGGRWEDLSRMQAYDVRGYGTRFLGRNIAEATLRPRGFRDAFAMWAGVEQIEVNQSTQRFRFGGRIGFETPALQDDRTAPGTVSPTSVTLDGGAQIRISPSWSMQLSYGLQVFSGVSVTRSDYDPRFALDCAANNFDFSTRGCVAVREGYAIPTAAGDYSRLSHSLRVGLRYERF
jgi:hypothetical protein